MKKQSTGRLPLLRRRDEAKALFRDAILDAAEVVFARSGFHAARIQDIASAARIAIGTVYNHFDTKEDVLRALLDERTAGLTAQMQPASGEPSDFAARLEIRVERLLRFMESHRDFFVVAAECGLVTQAPTQEMREVVGGSVKSFERFKAAFRALLQEGIDAGALAQNDPRILAAILGGTIRAISLSANRGDEPLASYAPVIVKLFLHGAAAAPSPTTRSSRR